MPSGPWEQFQTSPATPSPQAEAGPWTQFQAPGPAQAEPNQPRVGSGIMDAITAGWQGSATGLAVRGKLPDVVLDPQHSKWLERLASTATSTVSELPEMVGGAIAGGAAGSEVPILGNIVGAGIGAFAVPTALRTALMESYTKGEVHSVSDFLNRTAIVGAESAKSGLVGGLTAGVGLAAKPLGALAAGAAEIGTMTTASAALQGKLPEPEDFLNAAIMVGGLHAAGMVAGRMRDVYAKTGITPEQQVADAHADPTIAEDLKAPDVTPEELEAKIEAAAPAEAGDPGSNTVKWDPTSWAEANPEIPRAYQPAADAQAVQDAVPGTPLSDANRAAALEFFGPHIHIEDGLGVGGGTQINFQYLNTSSQMDGAIVKAMEAAVDEVQRQRRGVVSDADREQSALQALKEMVLPDGTLEVRQPGTPAGDAEIIARKAFVLGSIVDMAQKVKEFNAIENPTPEQAQEFMEAVARVPLAQAAANLSGAGAEAARSLRAMQDTDSVARNASLLLAAIEKTGNDPKQLGAMLAGIDTPEGMARMAKKVGEATKTPMTPQQIWKALMEGYKAALLGPLTVVKKSISDTVMAGVQLADSAVSVPVDKAMSIFRSGSPAESISASEPLAQAVGMVRGTADAVAQGWGLLKAAAAKVDATQGLQAKLGAAGDVVFGDVASGGITENTGAIPGRFGEVVRSIGFKPIEAVTTLATMMQERGEAYRLAAKHAAEEGFSMFTQEGRQRIAELGLNPQEADLDQIEAAGKERTFTKDLGPIGKSVQNLVDTAHLEPIVPFIKAPMNIFEQSVRHSPFALLMPSFWGDVKAGGEVSSRRISELVVGTGLTGLALAWASAGKMSGSGDPDPDKRRVALASGWQPYSMQIGDKWYSFRQVHPLGTLLGMAADVHEMKTYMSAGESDQAAKTMVNAFAHAVTEQTFLQGMDNAVHVMDDPIRYGGKWLQSTAASLVPASFSQTAMLVSKDPYKRQIDSIKDAIMARIPGLREQLEPQRDPYGEPVPNDNRLGVVSPVNVTTPSTDAVRAEMLRLEQAGFGVGAKAAPQSISLPAAHMQGIGKVELTPEQRDRFGDVSGHMAHQVMDSMVNNPMWAHVPDEIKRQMLEQAFAQGHSLASATVLSPEERQQEILRITGEISKRLSVVK